METAQLKSRIERVTKQWTPDSYILVPYSGKLVSFAYPAFGPDYYQNAGKAVLDNRLSLPTGEQTACLLNEVYTFGDKEFKGSKEAEFIRKDVMKDKYLWVFNRNLWMPRSADNAGVYVQHDAQAKGMSETLDVSQLEDMLSGGKTVKGVRFSKDGRTAFGAYNTMHAGTHDKGALSTNGFVIASYGVEGAEKLDEVSKAFTARPYVWLVENTGKNPVQSLSALSGYWDGDDRLGIYGGCVSDGRDGYAFGVSDSAQANA